MMCSFDYASSRVTSLVIDLCILFLTAIGIVKKIIDSQTRLALAIVLCLRASAAFFLALLVAGLDVGGALAGFFTGVSSVVESTQLGGSL